MSSEVGSGHISIFPVMTGFKSRITKGTKDAGAAGAKSFEGGFKGAGTRAGRGLGRDLKSALSSSAGDLGAAAMSKLTGEVASASSALSKVRLKQQDDAGRVRVAEIRLQEAIARSGEGSSQAAAAEERLASARRKHAATTGLVTSATERLKGAQDALGRATAGAGSAASGMGSKFKAGLSGLGSSASSAFQSIVGAAGRAASAAGRALGQGIKSAATAAVTAAATGIGVAFTKGIGRLTAIDTAQAKLRGLGNDASTVKMIMGDSLASVKGTAFGLGEAATVAAAAVAAQIKPGKALQAHLKNIANNASAAGMSMQEMGSIFNKAATQANGVQNDVIGQLADKGIPIYQELAKVLGVTAGEVFKMASDGKVDFETFSKAAEKAAGTVAAEMGKTVPGAAKNFFAAMGRIGANALDGLYSKIAPLIMAATSALGPIEERAKAFGAVLTKTVGPAIDWLTNLFTKLGSGAGLVGTGLSGLSGIIGPLGGAFAALGAGGLGGLIARIPVLGGMLGGLTGPLAALGGPLGIAAAAFAGFALSGGDAGALVGSITGMVDQVVAALPDMVQKVVVFVPQLVSGLLDQVPILLAGGVKIVEALVVGLVTAVPMLARGATSLVTGLIGSIVTMLPMIITGAIQLVTALIQGIVTAIPMLVTAAMQLVDGLLTAIIGALPMIIEGGIQLLMALIMGIVGALPQLLTAAVDLVMGLLDAIIDNLPMIIEAGIQLLLSLVTGLIDALPQLITAAINLVLQLVVGLLKMLPKLIEAGIQLVVSLITGLVDAIPQIITMMPEIVGAIVNGLLEVDWLDLGMQIIAGIINGMLSMQNAIGDAIADVAGAAFEGFKDFFGIASPAKRMIGPGRDIVRGAALGVDREQSTLDDSMREMAQRAARQFETQVGSVSGTVSMAVSTSRAGRTDSTAGSASATAGREINLTQHVTMQDPDPRVAGAVMGRELIREMAGA